MTKEQLWDKLDKAEDMLQEVWEELSKRGVDLGNDDGLILEMRDAIKELEQ